MRVAGSLHPAGACKGLTPTLRGTLPAFTSEAGDRGARAAIRSGRSSQLRLARRSVAPTGACAPAGGRALWTRRASIVAMAAADIGGSSDLLIVGPGVLGAYAGKLWKEAFPAATVVAQTNTTASHARCGAQAQGWKSLHACRQPTLRSCRAARTRCRRRETCGVSSPPHPPNDALLPPSPPPLRPPPTHQAGEAGADAAHARPGGRRPALCTRAVCGAALWQ